MWDTNPSKQKTISQINLHLNLNLPRDDQGLYLNECEYDSNPSSSALTKCQIVKLKAFIAKW